MCERYNYAVLRDLRYWKLEIWPAAGGKKSGPYLRDLGTLRYATDRPADRGEKK